LDVSFTPECERWLAGTTQVERDRYVFVLDAHRGGSVSAARAALVAADLGASDEALDDLAVIISRSPVFEFNADGSGLFRTIDGREHRFTESARFGGTASF
jgi:hypothetical protein